MLATGVSVGEGFGLGDLGVRVGVRVRIIRAGIEVVSGIVPVTVGDGVMAIVGDRGALGICVGVSVWGDTIVNVIATPGLGVVGAELASATIVTLRRTGLLVAGKSALGQPSEVAIINVTTIKTLQATVDRTPRHPKTAF